MVTKTQTALLVMCVSAQCLSSMGGDVVELDPFELPKVGLAEEIRGFIDRRPFDPYIKSMSGALLCNKVFQPIFESDDYGRPRPEVSNVTSIVVGRITDVQLLFVSAASSNMTYCMAWYVASVSVIENRKGNFPSKEFSFLFNDYPERHSHYYDWPYLPGLVYDFKFSGRRLVDNRLVSSFPPYMQNSVREWTRFRQEKPKDAKWVLEIWEPILGEIVNIHLEHDEYVRIFSVERFSNVQFRDYSKVRQTILSLKQKDVVEEMDLRLIMDRH